MSSPSSPARRAALPFAGGAGSASVVSHLAGVHSIGGGVLGFLTLIESNPIREVCVELREAVRAFPWEDMTRNKGSLTKWRAAFPAARAVNVSGRRDLVDADFVHLAGIHTLDMSGCDQAAITDGAFAHLRGIHTLDMSGCCQATITDGAFVYLRGIHTLDMGYCSQATITDCAFAHLRGIHTLNMHGCRQATITALCTCAASTRST
jgi:hypothetical protein